MFYFVPAWYSDSRQWYDNTSLWFRVFEKMTFDDSINQMKMFSNAGESQAMLLLNYQPQLRYFLHKQNLLDVDYWSFFDYVQNVHSQSIKPISYKDLDWPQGTQFIYSPFAIVAKKGVEILAIIHFAENGNLLHINCQKNGKDDKQYVFDDRGFLSSILYYDDKGQPLYQDYLNENGFWQIREHFQRTDYFLEVNHFSDRQFLKRFYQSWEDLLSECLVFLKDDMMSDEDTLIIASHQQHNDLLSAIFSEQKKVFSFFGSRFDLSDLGSLSRLLENSHSLVTATEKDQLVLEKKVLELGFSQTKISRISPFDTRLRLGQSQMVKELLIYVNLDGLSRSELEKAVIQILEVMEQNLNVTVSLVTFDHAYPLKELESWMLAKIHQQFDASLFMGPSENVAENQLDEDEELELKRISFTCLNNENQMIKLLDRTRLVVDLGNRPDLYTQIASISAGVPQINRTTSDYVSHMKNGWILEDLDQLAQAIHYYFDGLANWNASLVYTVQKMADYTSGRLLQQWKALLERD